jgi:hypothetical protein
MSATNRSDRSAQVLPQAATLPPALEAERRETNGNAGRLSYYVAGCGAPLLLIHSVNAAASAFEVRPIFESMRTTRRMAATPEYDRLPMTRILGISAAVFGGMLALERRLRPPR